MAHVLSFPVRAPRAHVTPEMRAQLEHAAQAALDTADRIIALLDRMDAAGEDREPNGDEEPSLGAPESLASQILWLRGSDSDREQGVSTCD